VTVLIVRDEVCGPDAAVVDLCAKSHRESDRAMW
jgi:hypothetical protein